MIYLLLAILSSVAVSVVMRLSTKKASGSLVMLSANYLMCTAIAAFFTGFGRLFPASPNFPGTLWMGAANGILYLSSFVIYQRSVSRNGIVLSSTFMKLGLLVPIVISVFMFRELPTTWQLLGFVIALVGIILMQLGGKDPGGRFSAGLLILLILGGGANAMSEIYEAIGDAGLNSQFLLYTFVAAFLLCCLMTVLKKERLNRYSILFGLLIGIPNYFSARF